MSNYGPFGLLAWLERARDGLTLREYQARWRELQDEAMRERVARNMRHILGLEEVPEAWLRNGRG